MALYLNSKCGIFFLKETDCAECKMPAGVGHTAEDCPYNLKLRAEKRAAKKAEEEQKARERRAAEAMEANGGEDYWQVWLTTDLEDVWLRDSISKTEEEVMAYCVRNRDKLKRAAGPNGDYSYHLRDGETGKIKSYTLCRGGAMIEIPVEGKEND